MVKSSAVFQGFVLACLAVQNCGGSFLLSYRRPESSEFNPASAVFLAEIIKLAVSMALVVGVSRRRRSPVSSEHSESRPYDTEISIRAYLYKELFSPQAALVALVAALFVVQTNLKVYSAPLISPTRLQILQEIKLIFVVTLSIWILKVKVNRMQWIAVLLITGAVILLQVQPTTGQVKVSAFAPTTPAQQRLGSLGILCVSMLSSLAGVLVESAMRTTDMWVINSQLSLFSLIPAAVPVIAKGRNIFAGYDWIAWLLVLNMALGGMLVALVVQHCSNIAKSLTSPFAIIASYIISSVFLGAPCSVSTILAAAIVVSACFIYHKAKRSNQWPEDSKPSPPFGRLYPMGAMQLSAPDGGRSPTEQEDVEKGPLLEKSDTLDGSAYVPRTPDLVTCQSPTALASLDCPSKDFI